MLGWFLRFVLLFLVVRGVWRFLAGVVEGGASRARPTPAARGVPLVRDPVCGTFVVRSRALTVGRGADTQFFCSERCRESFQRSERV